MKRNPYSRPDAAAVRAKAEGFPARSVYKLEEIDQRVKLLRPGMRVVDLGAAPGSWSMYVAKVIGEKGRLLSIDLSAIHGAIGPNVTVMQGDALDVKSEVFAEHGPFDVVLSDMAPATTGSRAADQWRSFELCMRAIEIAKAHGKPGSHFVGKIFMSEDFQKAREELRKAFEDVKTLRPDTVRKNSFEVFLVAKSKRLVTL
ncbi:MAG: RlmE family RNA methyltransferase [Polyangiaceae bacterium]